MLPALHIATRRTAVRVEVTDASRFPLPLGDLVVFMYHPFRGELVAKVVVSVEGALRGGNYRLYVIYYNPVFGELVDASPVLRRRFAGMVPYAAEELGYGPETTDSVVIWPGSCELSPDRPPRARIVLTSLMRAETEDSE